MFLRRKWTEVGVMRGRWVSSLAYLPLKSYNEFSFILKTDFSLSRPQSRSVCRKAVIPGDDGESNPMGENRV